VAGFGRNQWLQSSECADPGKLLRGIGTFLSMKKKAGLLKAVANDGEGVRYVVAA
jgi:hypothetical protein